MKNIVTALVMLALVLPCFGQTANPNVEAKGTQVIAIVLGKNVTATEKNKLNSLIVGPLIEKYAKENNIKPTAAELDAFVTNFEKITKQSPDTKVMEGMEEQMRLAIRMLAEQAVTSWKINKSLFQKYGGRVRFQQSGPEPLDAYRDFLREQEKKGAFRIIDKQYEPSFWQYYTNETMLKSPADDVNKFIKPLWE